ncbi:type II secretion system major pseudopilin GspG [Oleiharenicola lentus]|uniref:type II secretion system major pseudopilin GspG n=1 Tax=Oleiharenicola lentus TaxID=2508720 RepID=UPI003F664DA1
MKTLRSFPLRQSRKASAGFSILEMVVVLAIIGLILGLIVSKVGNTFTRSQEDVAKIFVKDSVSLPLTRYRIDLGSVPSTSEGLAALITAPSSVADRWRGPYLEATGGKIPLDPYGEPYQYRSPGVKNTSGYDVFSKGADKLADTADDIGNW